MRTTGATPSEAARVDSRRFVIAILVVGAAIVAGLMTLAYPLWGIVCTLAAVVGALVLRHPDVASYVVIFLLYSNVAVVATRFHGVPKIMASAFPLLLVFPLVRDMVLRRRGAVVTPALPFIALLFAVQFFGALFARHEAVARAAIVEFMLEGVLVYILITNVVRTPRTLKMAVWALLLAGVVCSVVPFYQQLTGTFHHHYGGFGQTSETAFRTGEFAQHGEVRQFRACGTLDEQNRFAQNMLMLLPLGLFLFLNERTRRKRFVVLALTSFAGIGFLLAFSRGGAVALALVLMVMTLMRLIALRHVAVLGLVMVVGLVAMPQYWTRLASLGDVSLLVAGSETNERKPDSAMTGRLTEMVAAALVFADHPVIGVGPRMFKYYSQEYGNRLGIRKLKEGRKAHSLYLEVAAESGTLGLLSFFGMIFVTLTGLVVTRRRAFGESGRGLDGSGEESSCEAKDREMANLATGFLLALIGYLACGIFLHLSYIRFFYLILALASATTAIARKQRHTLQASDLANGEIAT